MYVLCMWRIVACCGAIVSVSEKKEKRKNNVKRCETM